MPIASSDGACRETATRESTDSNADKAGSLGLRRHRRATRDPGSHKSQRLRYATFEFSFAPFPTLSTLLAVTSSEPLLCGLPTGSKNRHQGCRIAGLRARIARVPDPRVVFAISRSFVASSLNYSFLWLTRLVAALCQPRKQIAGRALSSSRPQLFLAPKPAAPHAPRLPLRVGPRSGHSEWRAPLSDQPKPPGPGRIVGSQSSEPPARVNHPVSS